MRKPRKTKAILHAVDLRSSSTGYGDWIQNWIRRQERERRPAIGYGAIADFALARRSFSHVLVHPVPAGAVVIPSALQIVAQNASQERALA